MHKFCSWTASGRFWVDNLQTVPLTVALCILLGEDHEFLVLHESPADAFSKILRLDIDVVSLILAELSSILSVQPYIAVYHTSLGIISSIVVGRALSGSTRHNCGLISSAMACQHHVFQLSPARCTYTQNFWYWLLHLVYSISVLLRSFRCEVSIGDTRFSFLAFFALRISCDVLDISNDSGRFRDPLPTISKALLPSRTWWFSAACDLDFPWSFLSVHAARTNTWKLNGPRVVKLYSSAKSIVTGEMFCAKVIRNIQRRCIRN